MARYKHGIAAGLLVALAACGGGGEPVVTSPAPTPPSTPSFPAQGDTQMWATRAALLDDYTDPTIYTALSSVPTSGTATYEGYFAGQLANTTDNITDTLIGAMTLDVRSAASSVSVSGSVNDFVDSNDNDLSGQLSLTAGSLDRAGNPSSDATLMMTASGTLTDAQGRTLVMGTQLEGDFLGAGHAAVGGDVLGSVRVNGVDQDFDGGFIAER